MEYCPDPDKNNGSSNPDAPSWRYQAASHVYHQQFIELCIDIDFA